MKPIRTWILIANSTAARIIENDGPGKGLFQPSGLARQAANEVEYADQPGRSFNSSGVTRSKMEPHQRAVTPGDGFAGELIDDLTKNQRLGKFERLIICAAPAMLSQIRELMPDQVKTQVVAEIPKDLTHVPVEQLPPHFEKVLAV